MAWRVKEGRHLTHDDVEYAAGATVPEDAAKSSAVEWVGEPVVMKAEAPKEPVAATVETKKRK